MSNAIKSVIYGALSMAIGIFIGIRIGEKRSFENEEPEEIKIEEPAEKRSEDIHQETPPSMVKKPIEEYVKAIENSGYISDEGGDTMREYAEKPYVISPDDYGSEEDYDQITLLYYADHILADDDDSIIEDIESAVGFDSLTHFGEYDDDCVCVRNERLKVDYEILRSLRTYAEIVEDKPYLRRDL